MLYCLLRPVYPQYQWLYSNALSLVPIDYVHLQDTQMMVGLELNSQVNAI